MRNPENLPGRHAAGIIAVRPQRSAVARLARVFVRLAAAGTLATVIGSCGDEDPTLLGNDLRSPPDTLRAVELTAVLVDSVFHLPISMGGSPTGQIGMQKLYTTHLLLDFCVPTFVLDDGDTLLLDDGQLEISFVDAAPQTYDGTMQLSLHEVSLAGRGWGADSILTGLPELRPGPPASTDTIPSHRFGDPDFQIEMALDPKALLGFDEALLARDSLDVNVACVFDTFTIGDKGFIEFPYRSNARVSNVRFAGNYRTPANTGITSSSTPEQTLVIVEFDSNYSPGTNLVVSDGYRLNTYVRFPDVHTVLPESAFVHAADLILVQADRGDSIFGTGPDLGVIVPSDTTLIYDEDENERALSFSTTLIALPESEISINITAYLFDQQEDDVENTGMLLRVSNQGTKARHFEFFGAQETDPARRPRIRIVYGLPADFGEGGP